MAGSRSLLHEDDVVLYAAPTKEALHAAVLQLYEQAKAKASANDPEWTDADGEIHQRRYRFVFGEDREDLTVKQRGFLHAAVFPQIAEQVVFPDGTRFVAKVWKEHFRERFLGDRWVVKRGLRWDPKEGRAVPAKRATPRKERVSTEDLSIKQYSEYIDKVIDTATVEYGVTFVFEPHEREEVRWKPKPRRNGAGATK